MSNNLKKLTPISFNDFRITNALSLHNDINKASKEKGYLKYKHGIEQFILDNYIKYLKVCDYYADNVIQEIIDLRFNTCTKIINPEYINRNRDSACDIPERFIININYDKDIIDNLTKFVDDILLIADTKR